MMRKDKMITLRIGISDLNKIDEYLKENTTYKHRGAFIRDVISEHLRGCCEI